MRPEFRHDRVTYDLITPHAARGVLDVVYRRPGMTWVIDAIRILHPIRREIVESGDRRIVTLSDVAYLVDAHFDLAVGEPPEAAGRHTAMFKRALRDGAAVYLGSAEYVGAARLAYPAIDDAQPGMDGDFGWLLHGPNYAGDRRPRFFRAVATDGRIVVPPPDSPLLFG